MTTPPNPVPGNSLEGQTSSATVMSATRPFYWSVRREVWENRSIYIAPLAAAGVAMLGFFAGLFSLPRSAQMRGHEGSAHEFLMMVMPYGHTAWLLLIAAFVVGVFYSLDALYGERRDRSILFWKSLPVSDLTAVLSKASIPMVVLPALVFVIGVLTNLIMVLISTAVLVLSGINPMTLWRQLPLVQFELVLLYGVIVLALGQAPLFAGLLLISGWARRTAFLWAILPPLAICFFEKLVFHTMHFAHLLGYLVTGGATNAFSFRTPAGEAVDPHFIPLAQITPGRFLSSPGLWIGLGLAAVFLAAAVRLRRYREPI
jgi:ABC-2 type transport system permease protein